jgi:hypothetical protein
MPSRKHISTAIHDIYTFTQSHIKAELKVSRLINSKGSSLPDASTQAHTGGFYVACDGWQSANQVEVLGVVIFWLECPIGSLKYKFRSVPLDFVPYVQLNESGAR